MFTQLNSNGKAELIRQPAKLEQFKLKKDTIDTITRSTMEVKSVREFAVIKDLLRAGATLEDIMDIYNDNPIGRHTGFQSDPMGHIQRLVDNASQAKTEIIRKILADNGFEFYRNLCTDVIHIKTPSLEGLQEFDDYSMAHVNQIAIDTEVGTRKDFEDVVRIVASQNAYHPLKDYFESLEWDGQDHIGKLAGYVKDLHDPVAYNDGTKRTVFHAYLRRFLVGAVAKIYVDSAQNPMLVMYGKQDDGKSTFAGWFSPKKEWLKEGPLDPDSKEDMGDMRYKLIWEVGELGSTIRKADRDSLKRVLTQQTITMRNPYDRRPTDKPVVTSFIGTVNATESGFLNDASGNRRFNVVEIASLDWDYAKDVDVNQVWAQAYALFKAGEPYRLTEEEKMMRDKINHLHEQVDPLEELLLDILEVCDPHNLNVMEKQSDVVAAMMQLDTQVKKKEAGRILSNFLTRRGFVIARNKKLRDGRNCWLGIRLKAEYVKDAQFTFVNGKRVAVRPEEATEQVGAF